MKVTERSGLQVTAAIIAMFVVGGALNARAQTAVPASRCSLAPVAASPRQLTSGGLARTYRLFVPAGFEGRMQLPLVLDLHGSGGTAAGEAQTSGLEALAARRGFAVASLQAEGGRWNVPVADGRPDDVAYVSDVIDHVSAQVCIDRARVYATGFSGGARMSSLLGCRLSARIAAIAPMSGLRWPDQCNERPMPVFTVHGLADPQNTYDGHATGRGAEWVESVPEALAGWGRHNHCDPTPIADDPPGPLSTIRYQRCAEGADVRIVRVDGLTHRWSHDEFDATAAMWEFFEAHTMAR